MACSKCGRHIPIEGFAIFRTRKGEIRRRGICKDCRGRYAIENFERLKEYRKNYHLKHASEKRERDYLRKKENKKIVDKIKESNACVDCGRKFPAVAMDFDHVEGKNCGVASLVAGGYRIELILREIKLCDLVCACCHRIRTAKRKDNLSPKE